MNAKQFIATLTNEQREQRINELLKQLNDCHDKSCDRAKSIRHALRLHDYRLRERNRRYDYVNNTIL